MKLLRLLSVHASISSDLSSLESMVQILHINL